MNHSTFCMLLIFIILLILFFIHKLRKIYNYWKSRGIVGPTPLPILGNYAPVIFRIETEADLLRKLYEQYPKEKYIGIYKGIHPALLIRNRNMIKQILTNDFDHFNVRCIEKPISVYDKSLYVMDGDEKWKILRKTFSPGLNISRITFMLPKIHESLQNYLRYIDNLTDNYSRFEMRNLNNKYVLDTFSKLIFGQHMKVYCNNNAFEKTVLQTVNSKLQLSVLQIINLTCPILLKNIPGKLFSKFDSFYKIFKKFIESLIHNLKNMKEQGKVSYNFLNYLVMLKEKDIIKNEINSFDIDDDFIIQQTMTFFLAAFEPISNTLTFLMYELSQNQDVQTKCIEEVDSIFNKNNGQITMELLSEMKYVQMTVDETLRKHAAANAIDRKCIKKYIFHEENLSINEYVSILIPVHGLHYDSKYFPNPEVFNPERFSTENKPDIMEYSYLPFGKGPRMCIGSRLAKAVILIGIYGFLSKFEVQATTDDIKLKYDPTRTRAVTPYKDIWLKIKRRHRE